MTIDDLPDTDGAVLRWTAPDGVRQHVVLDYALGDDARTWWRPGSHIPLDDAVVVRLIGDSVVEVWP